ncbi:membrane protein [Cnuibacter physcomitrellae]|uniref:EamA family transporter n=1 Tax=Cnuibacter physcomitrellae TaxID=1619308 RepID=A0A1X9LMQ2_9MICO|nr:DMT family transporter [Cnuibacter physcomitrellae]ARJ06387.1 EamA family transporter [Cnuibacter physcomitrellae]GGI37892.1 membrane protein [Cnuibacter physcomitrellae]
MVPLRALAAGLLVVVLWASAFPAIRVAAPVLGVTGLSFVRLAVASLALVVCAVVVRARLPRMRDLGWILACGFFGMAAYQLLLNQGELDVPAGTASIIVAAAPLVSVAAARVLFRERISAVTVLGSAIALGGVAFVCLARAGVSLSGSVWIVVAAMVVQGIYHPLQRPLLARYTSIEVACYAMIAGTIMTLPLVPFDVAGLVDAGPQSWLAAVYLGLLPSAAGFVLWAYAVARMPVAASTALLYLVPPIAVLVAWVWLGEAPILAELLGGLVVILGVVTISVGPRVLAARRGRPGPARRQTSRRGQEAPVVERVVGS